MSHKEETYLNGVFSVYPIVISEFLECHSKAQSTSLFMSVAMNQLLRVVQRAVHGKLRSDFQRVIGDRVAVKVAHDFVLSIDLSILKYRVFPGGFLVLHSWSVFWGQICLPLQALSPTPLTTVIKHLYSATQ